VELGAPLLLLVAHTLPDPVHAENCAWVGWLTLTAMHIYIVSHFAHADVNCLNWLSAHALYYCHVHAHHGFVGFGRLWSETHPIALLLLALDASYSLYGHLNTDSAWQSQTYKYWSGNYSNATYFMTKAGKRKLDAAIGNPENPILSRMGLPPLENLGPKGLGLLDARKMHIAKCRQLAAMFWMQLDTRILPKLVADHYKIGLDETNTTKAAQLQYGEDVDVIRSLDDFGLISHGMLLNQWLLGMCSHEIKYVPFVMDLLQAECKFSEGDFVCFEMYAFPTLSHFWGKERKLNDKKGGTGKWIIRDAKAGVVRTGSQSASTVANMIAQPSSWQKLAD
jgi:hypothetical protein